MNPEEFDKSLSESFRNEHLPPDKRLWQNISSRLDENRKKPLWFWLIPVVIVAAVFGGWFISGNNPDKKAIAVQTTERSIVVSEDSESKIENIAPVSKETIKEKVKLPNAVNNTSSSDEKLGAKIAKKSAGKNDLALMKTPAVLSKKGVKPHSKNSSNFLVSYVERTFQTTEEELYKTFLRMNTLIRPANPYYIAPKEELIAYDFPFKNRKTYKSPYAKNPVNYDSKWWWSAGLGPQIAFNKAIIPNDSQEWVHKELWANRRKMSRNGTGFQAQFLVGHKLGKYFSVEAGLQYSLHTEDIRFSMLSYEIESRDKNHKITRYDSIQLWIRVWNPATLQYDTTFYDATRGFSLAIKNRYHIFTIPVKLNVEFDITDRTKFVAGIGAGISMITTKKATHLNLINDKETLDKKAKQFTASLSAQFGFYTNFNDIGLLGIYSGFQMYTQPWEISNKQYGIKMSDLQLGLSFRRPLNW